MAKVYADLILKGAICSKTNAPWTIEDVPLRLRSAVEAILNAEE